MIKLVRSLLACRRPWSNHEMGRQRSWVSLWRAMFRQVWSVWERSEAGIIRNNSLGHTCWLLVCSVCDRCNRHSSAVLLLRCPAAIETGSRSNAAAILCTRYQVPGITYWCKKSFGRTQSFTYHAPGITYTYKKIKRGTRYQALAGVFFKPLFSIGSIHVYIIYIYIWSGVLLCFVRMRLFPPWTPPQRHARYNTSYTSYQICRQK